MPDIEIKWCMGQSTGLEGRYIKPQADSGIYTMVLERHDKKAGCLDAIDWLTVNNENRLKRENEMLRVKKSEYESLKQELEQHRRVHESSVDKLRDQIQELNERLGL
jgi:hypothetical protein